MDMGQVFITEILQGCQHRVGGALPQAAEAGVFHQIAEVFQGGQIVWRPPSCRYLREGIMDLPRSHPAGHAFTAGLGHTELHKEFRHIHHAGGLIHDDHAAGTHDRADLGQGVIVHRHIQELLRDTAA